MDLVYEVRLFGRCVWVCRRCADLDERERELLRNQGSLQEALVQVAARAHAAEEKLEKRIGELQYEHKEVIAVMTTNATASLEVCGPLQLLLPFCFCVHISGRYEKKKNRCEARDIM